MNDQLVILVAGSVCGSVVTAAGGWAAHAILRELDRVVSAVERVERELAANGNEDRLPLELRRMPTRALLIDTRVTMERLRQQDAEHLAWAQARDVELQELRHAATTHGAP